MKFTKHEAKRVPQAAVAYIDSEGDLRFKNAGVTGGIIALHGGSNTAKSYDSVPFNPESAKRENVFYPGDSITINF